LGEVQILQEGVQKDEGAKSTRSWEQHQVGGGKEKIEGKGKENGQNNLCPSENTNYIKLG
jgi:hypothetical protein